MDWRQGNEAKYGVFYLTIILLSVSLTSCVGGLNRNRWSRPKYAAAEIPPSALVPPSTTVRRPNAIDTVTPSNVSSLDTIQSHYRKANELEQQFSPRCLNHYFHAATLCWPTVVQTDPANVAAGEQKRVWEIYHSSVGKLANLAPKYGRWHPAEGLQLDGEPMLRASYHSTPWQPSDFQTMQVVGEYSSASIRNYHRADGVGVPLVVTGKRSPTPRYMRATHVFGATAVLHPVTPPQAGPNGWMLSLHDPLRVTQLDLPDGSVPLARDTTAPIVYQLSDTNRSYLVDLLRPDNPAAQAKLTMIEPHQPGKIPLVFVHGLASDRFTWAEMANDLRAQPDLQQRYQIWAFEYPTGRPFLESAASLRDQLLNIRAAADPTAQDKALDQMVLVGHSLGGLVSKLQVTYSDQQVWKAVSFEDRAVIRAESQKQEALNRLFFFEPVPSVRRVVFIGTPHRGSLYARRFVGRVTSSLVRLPDEEVRSHRRLVDENPGAFSSEIRRRIPNSVDLLEPESRVLRAIFDLRIGADVQLHSIIGTGGWIAGTGPGDGVVPVSSARHPGTATEMQVEAVHQNLQKTPESVEELRRILRLHAAAPRERPLALRMHSRRLDNGPEVPVERTAH